MIESGAGLYVLLGLLAVLFWWKARRASTDELFARAELEHHRVQRVAEKHPRGGTWNEHKGWMAEEA